MKRLSFILISLVLCCSIIFGCISVSAEDLEVDGMTVIDYRDYITGYDIYNYSDGWAYLTFKPEFFTSYKEDKNGRENSTAGTKLWQLAVDSDTSEFSAYVTSQVPGGGLNKTFLDLNYIPSGSKFHYQCVVSLDDYVGQQCELLITLFNGIKYYDEDFNYISGYHPEENNYTIELLNYTDDTFSQICEIDIIKPENAKYAVLYSRVEFGIGRSNVYSRYINISAQFLYPSLKISTSYTQIIINAIVQARPPEGYGTVIDLKELELLLSGQAGGGIQDADSLFQGGQDVIKDFASAFTFMNLVFSSLASSAWLSGILTVSLSLGMFTYLVNGAISIGGSIERKKAKQNQGKKGKGGG